MFKKLKDSLPKGKKLMDLKDKERDKYKEEMNDMIQELKQFVGADGVVIHFHKDETKTNGHETLTAIDGLNVAELLPLFDNLLEKLTDALPQRAIAAIEAAQKTFDVEGAIKNLLNARGKPQKGDSDDKKSVDDIEELL